MESPASPSSKRPPVSELALWTAIVAAPVAGGSSHLWMLPVLAVLVVIAYASTVLEARARGRALHLTWLVAGLLGLCAFTVFQLLPLPSFLLGLLSPRALEIREFVGGGLTFGPLTYEPAATAREAAKLLIAALIAITAYEQTRARGRFRSIAVAVVVAGIASAAVALIHRALGVDRMLGVLPAQRHAAMLITTFVNPNHAAGFMALATLCGAGLALRSRERNAQLTFLGAALVTAAVSVLSFSRGGLLALASGMLGATILVYWRAARGERSRTSPLGLGVMVIGGVFATAASAIFWRHQSVLREFTGTDEDPLGVASKIAAAKDAVPLILDHPWLGIGRGSYESIYPLYKSSAYQYTFTHPENVAAQLTSDWGLIIGLVALGALVSALAVRIRRSRSIIELCALAGVAALALQNLVDFSLELPAVMISVAAILGATSVANVRAHRVQVIGRRGLLLGGVPCAALLALCVLAFSLGDLRSDLEDLQTTMAGRQAELKQGIAGETADQTLAPLRAIAARHPANAVVAASLAFLAENANPPDLAQAIRWANKALYLAPNYGDGHLTAGRCLLRAGHRRQGLGELRTAWSLARGTPHANKLAKEIIRLARDPSEVWIAIPRRDLALDLVDSVELARAVRLARASKKAGWDREILAHVSKPGDLEPEREVLVALEAMRSTHHELAARLLEVHAAEDPRAAELLLELRMKEGDLEEVERMIADLLGRPRLDPARLLRIRAENAAKRGDFELARLTLEELRRTDSPTQTNQVIWARSEASIERRAGNLNHALSAIGHAIELAPAHADLRVERARILAQIGRDAEAQSDLQVALRLKPEHREAGNLLARLRARAMTRTNATVEKSP